MTGSRKPDKAPVWTPPASDEAAENATAAVTSTALPVSIEPVVGEPVHSAGRRAPARRSGSTSVMLAIGALIAVGGIGFAVGHATGGNGTSTQTGTNDQPGVGQFGPDASGRPEFAGGLGGFAITGTVVSVSADSITLKLADGSTTTIQTGSATTYHSQASAASTDVTAGDTVSVQTTGGGPDALPGVSASSATTTRTATDVTITGQ